MDYIGPTPYRSPVAGGINDLIGGLLGYMRDPRRTQQLQGLAGLLESTGIPKTVERLAYGEPLTNVHMANVPLLKPETAEAVLTLLPMPIGANKAAMAAGRAGERVAERVVPQIMERGGMPASLLGDLAQGSRSQIDKYSPEQISAWAAQKRERELLQAQQAEILRQQEKQLANKNIKAVGKEGSSKFFTPEEIENQRFFYQAGDSAGARAEGKLNTVNAIERYLIENNIPIEKVSFSKDNNSKSIYANIKGKTVRISDHYLPETPQRLHNKEQGLTGKWQHEVIVGDWRTDLDDYIKQITDF